MKNEQVKKLPRLINVRKVFICFIGIVVGILLSYNFFVSLVVKNSTWWFYTIIVFTVILLIFGIVCLKYKNIIKFERIKNIISILNIFNISLFIGLITCITHCNIFLNTYDFNGKGVVTANVSHIEEYGYGSVFVLDDASVLTDDGIVMLSGKARVYVGNYQIDGKVNIGSKVSFPCSISANKISNSEDLQKLVNGYGYEIKVDFDDDQKIQVVSNLLDLRSQIKNYISDILYNNMSNTNAGLAFSMLFGDKSTLDENVSENFSNSGVMHLLAVSGLHVGVISGVVYFFVSFITKKMGLKFKTRSIVDLIVVGLFLLFYSY